MSIPSFLPYNVIIVYDNNILNVCRRTCKVCTETGGNIPGLRACIYTILHSVAAVYVLSVMDVFKLYADCFVCRTTGRKVNSQYESEYCLLTSTPCNTMDNIARCQLVLGSPKMAARTVFDTIVLKYRILTGKFCNCALLGISNKVINIEYRSFRGLVYIFNEADYFNNNYSAPSIICSSSLDVYSPLQLTTQFILCLSQVSYLIMLSSCMITTF